MLARIVVVIIGLWTLIQALVYGTMAVLAILVRGCQIAMDDSQLSQWMYAIYFRDKACSSINWNGLFRKTLMEEPQFPDNTIITFRTNAIAMVYLAISSFWLVTSIMLIAAACLRPLTKRKYYFLFHPWIYASLLNILLDVVAAGFFIYDLIQSSNIESFFANLEMKNGHEIAKDVTALDKLAMAPAMIFIAASLRALVIWIFNIVQIFLIVRMGNEIMSEFRKVNKKSTSMSHHHNAGADYITETEQTNEQYNSSSQLTEQSNRYNDPSRNYNYDNFGQEYDRQHQRTYSHDPSTNYSDRRQSKQATDINKQSNDDNLHWKKNSDNLNVAYQRNKNRTSGDPNGKTSKKTELTTHNYDTNLLRPSDLKIQRPHLLIAKDVKKPRTLYQSQEYDDTIDSTNRRSSINATDELRSQLPWSYFKGRTDIARPPKKIVQQNVHNGSGERLDEEDSPPVPVPDYTMHFALRDQRYSNNAKDGK